MALSAEDVQEGMFAWLRAYDLVGGINCPIRISGVVRTANHVDFHVFYFERLNQREKRIPFGWPNIEICSSSRAEAVNYLKHRIQNEQEHLARDYDPDKTLEFIGRLRREKRRLSWYKNHQKRKKTKRLLLGIIAELGAKRKKRRMSKVENREWAMYRAMAHDDRQGRTGCGIG